MNVVEAIEKRRAVKSFDPAHRMSAETEQALLHLLRLAPTSFNIQHWRLVLLKDPAHRRKIRAAAWDQAQVTDASLVVVLCGDTLAWAKQPERYWAKLPAGKRQWLVDALTNFYREHPQRQYDEVLRSAGIAAQTLMLAAKALGYDSCPMVGFDEQEVGRLINLPRDHKVCMMVAVGKALAPAFPRGGEIPAQEMIFEDRFPQDEPGNQTSP